MSSKIYFPPSLQRFEPRYMALSTWVDHLPFAYDLVEAIRPKMVVELGVYNGVSFFTFCQALVEHDIDAVAYGIDSWEGDAHTNAYDESVYSDVANHARAHYRGVSYLLKMYFSEALQHFEEGSIDLLHIDGLHTYQAVREDFDNWYPKVRPGGIILFHDVMARIKDFRAWQFFQEVEESYEDTFKFNHGYGLGVMRKPGGDSMNHPLNDLLFASSEVEKKHLRQFYTHAAHFLEARRQANRVSRDRDKGGH